MNKEYQHSEMIDAYLRNELSTDQRADFEQLVQKDPLLYNEFLLQQEIVTNIQSYRKAQLKNRLNQIDVSNTSSWGASSAGVWIGGLALVGVLAWFGYSSLKNNNDKIAILSETATVNVAPNSQTVSSVQSDEKVSEVKSAQAQETDQSIGKASQSTAEEAKAAVTSTSLSKRASGNQNKTKSASSDQLVALNTDNEINPALQEESLKKADTDVVLEKPAVYGNTSSATNRLNVVDNTNETLKLHYYYRNGRIALLGFDKPYTFLDMPDENTTYLYYEGNFYKLNVHQVQPAPIQGVLIMDKVLTDSLNKMLLSRK